MVAVFFQSDPRSSVVADGVISSDQGIDFLATSTPPRNQRQRSLRFVMFSLGNMDLALPIATVVKIVNLGTVAGNGQSPWGVVTLGNQPYTVIDLHHYLFQTPLEACPHGGYLVFTAFATGELVGIPTIGSPTLVDVPWDQVRLLPDAYRRADRLAVASHLARWTDPETQGEHFLFVLDVSGLSDLVGRV